MHVRLGCTEGQDQLGRYWFDSARVWAGDSESADSHDVQLRATDGVLGTRTRRHHDLTEGASSRRRCPRRRRARADSESRPLTGMQLAEARSDSVRCACWTRPWPGPSDRVPRAAAAGRGDEANSSGRPGPGATLRLVFQDSEEEAAASAWQNAELPYELP